MAGASTIGKLLVELGLDDSDFRGGIAGATSALEGMQETAGGLAKTLDTVVAGAMAAAGAAVVAFGYLTVKTGADFQQAFTTVGALSGATTEEMRLLEQAARELGASTKYSATEAAVAMQELAAAGLSANEIISASGPALLLAAAGSTDLGTATGLMAATFNQFGLDATNAARVADVFSTAMNNSLLDISSITEAMKYAGTAGAGFGMSLEETTAAVASFRDLGLEGSMAGTNFRAMLDSAATVTEKGTAVLKKYGLTVEQLSPELNSFAEIMKSIGDAGITTTDAIEVFGSRAGANVAQIARSFADGSTNYYTLLGAMEDSAGSTQVLYDTMTNTVAANMEQVGGATEELMLSVFDTFSGPLNELMVTLADTIAYVATVFQNTSGEIGTSFADTIGSVVEYLKSNKEEIALSFVSFANGVSSALALLVQMLPMVISLGKAMLLVWVADKVRVFVIAVQAGYVAVTALGGGVRALMLAITAASGGLYAVVAAIGTLVAGIIYFVSSSNAAADAADRLREAQDRVAAATEARAAKERAAADALADSQATTLGAAALQLQASGQLTAAIDAQLSSLQGLSSEQINAGIKSGELFTANVNGTEVVLSHTAALQLQYDGTELAGEASRAYKAALKEASIEVDNATTAHGKLVEAVDTYQLIERTGINTAIAAKTQFGEYGGTLEGVAAEYDALEKRVGESTVKLAGLTRGAELASQALHKSEVAAEIAGKAEGRLGDAAGKAGAAVKKGASESQKAYEARLKVVERVEDAIAKRLATGTQKLAMEMAEQLETINEAFNAEVKAYGKQTAKIKAAELERARVVQLVRADSTAQAQAAQAEAVAGLAAAQATAQQTAAQRAAADEQLRLTERRNALKATFDAERNLYEVGAAERLDVMIRYFDASRALDTLELSEQAQRATQAQAAVDGQVSQMRLEDAASTAAGLQAIETQRQGALLAAEGASAAQIAEINAVFDGRVTARKAQLKSDVLLLVAGTNRRVIELERERDATLAQLGEDQTVERQQVADYYAAAIADAGSDATVSTEEAAEAASEAWRKFGNVIAGVAVALGSGLAAAAEGTAQLFKDMTGFAFDLVGAVNAVNESMAERAKLDAQLASGELSPDAYAAALAELPATAAEAAAQYVTELVNGASQLLMTFVEAAPELVRSLAAQLPGLVAEFAAALPGLVQEMMAAIGPLITALLAEIPKLVQALADSVGIVIAAIVQQLPGLVANLLDALMAALPTVTGAVMAIMKIVPQLVQEIILALPIIIQGLVSSLGTLVTALVGVVIQLVQVVIQQLPTIIQALVAAVLELVQVLLAAIPSLIIGIVQQLPTLITALLGAVTVLIQQVVAALPTIIESLLMAVTDIFIAVVEMMPVLLTAIVEMLPGLIDAIISLIPALISGIVNALPTVIRALIGAVPVVIEALFTQLLPAIFKAIPDIIASLFVALFYEIPKFIIESMALLGMEAWKLIEDGVAAIGAFFDDVLAEIVSLGATETKTFGDTPGAVKAGAGGMAARFAAGDYVVAAQRPADLLRQAMDAMQGQFASALGPAGRGYSMGEMEVPAAAGLAQAMMQAASAMREGFAGGGGAGGSGGMMKVVVQANGRTLDEVLYEASLRGEAPRLASELRRSTLRAGVHVGFNRGKFSP